MNTDLHSEAITLLQSLVKIKSYSGEEDGTAELIVSYLDKKKIKTQRLHNNIYAYNKHYNSELPTIVLNSHHDTVQIGDGWTQDPLGGKVLEEKLYGRGSNDAGGPLVSLIVTFTHFYEVRLPFNLLLIASGEEENFGPQGVSSVLELLTIRPVLGIIGEPTEMQVGIAEKGLIVIDAVTTGKSGHAARETGINALYIANTDITQIRNYNWSRVSEVLGPTKTTVTQITSGSQHNVIPDTCHYVIDCRVNECYTLQEVLSELQSITKASLTPRSLRWHPSGIDKKHPIVKKGLSLGIEIFGSPTLSDQVHFSCPTIKIGPGKSERSHTADEFITITEIKNGIEIYINLIKDLQL